MIAALRRDRGFATQLAPRTLHEVASLLGAERPSDAPISPTDARELTDVFVRYYHHGAPFRRDVLAYAWRRCRDSAGGDSCRTGQALAEERLGPLGQGARLGRGEAAARRSERDLPEGAREALEARDYGSTPTR
jgi:hypothetical protein